MSFHIILYHKAVDNDFDIMLDVFVELYFFGQVVHYSVDADTHISLFADIFEFFCILALSSSCDRSEHLYFCTSAESLDLIDDLIEHGRLHIWSDAWYLNILLTFSCAIPLGYCLTDLKAALKEKDRAGAKKPGLLLLAGLTLAVGVNVLFAYLRSRGGSMEFDYGIWGMLLPLFALPFDGKRQKLAAFTAGTALFCIGLAPGMPYIWFSMPVPALLAFYNGKPGSRRLKYGFYIFYPVHLGLLYLINILFF